MFQDKSLNCRDCGNDFTFTASEQEFFSSKGFQNEPSRCPECRQARKQQNNRGGSFGRPAREMHKAVCANCNQETEVPFRPTGERPVYCKDCYQPKNRY